LQPIKTSPKTPSDVVVALCGDIMIATVDLVSASGTARTICTRISLPVPSAFPKGSLSLSWLFNDTAQATTEIKPKPAVASRGLIPEPRRSLKVSQWLYEV
jgi:hypothetical protein